MAVAAEQHLDFRRTAERVHHPRHAFDVRCMRSAREGKAASSPVKIRLGDARDVAIGDNAERADLVKHVRDGHPRDVDVVRSELLWQQNPCQGYSDQKKKCGVAHRTSSRVTGS